MPKLCDYETCRNRATYGLNCDPIRCSTHKEPSMKLSCTLCICGKQPFFNFKDMAPKFCANCKKDGMIDVKNKKCFCGKSQPRFNYEGLKPQFCNDCKHEGMINLLFKQCKCGKRARYNYPELKSEYCKDCKTDGMVDCEKKRCECGKRATFNYDGLKPEYCTKCKQEEMIDLCHKKCKCGTRPTFNYEGLKAEYCVLCKKDEMINVTDDRCKADNCETRGNKNYKGYCANCFQHLFPTDPLTFQIRSKTKEIAVRDFINSRFEGFQHDKPLWYNESACDCTTKRRIDHRKLINDTLLCIETDENQHKYYSKEDEIARYNDLFMAYGGKFIFIRFNPDKYIEDGKSRNPMLVNRLPVLESEINKQIKRIEMSENTELLEVIELYYDKK